MSGMSEIGGGETGLDVRRAARAGYSGLTVGRARGYVQANLVVLPKAHASEFEAFCRANERACPLLAVGEAGDAGLSALGADLDVRTDLPAYLVHEAGATRRASEIDVEWSDDLVAFAIGCWFAPRRPWRRMAYACAMSNWAFRAPCFAPTGRPSPPVASKVPSSFRCGRSRSRTPRA
jgi:hypothetical protein